MSKVLCEKKQKTKDSCEKIGHLLRFAKEYFRPANISVWVGLGMIFHEPSLDSWHKKWDFSLGLLRKFIVSQVVCLGMAALQGAALSLPCLVWESESPGSGLVCQGVGGTFLLKDLGEQRNSWKLKSIQFVPACLLLLCTRKGPLKPTALSW